MKTLKLKVNDEKSELQKVILGIAEDFGGVPDMSVINDPKSLENVLKGTYPVEKDMIREMKAFADVLQKHGVEVIRPKNIPGLNQIFARDIGFVIDDFFIKSNILPSRAKELSAIDTVISMINSKKVIAPPQEVHVEGGDVILHGEWIFVGTYYGADYADLITARTNPAAIQFLTDLFPSKKVKAFDLVKSNTDARVNALHLDCCFQPVGEKYAIIHQQGFKNDADYHFLVDFFGEENLFKINSDEMYEMMSNVFSIRPDLVVIEEGFDRLELWLYDRGIAVEKVPFAQIGKQEGLLRCSTLPLLRK